LRIKIQYKISNPECNENGGQEEQTAIRQPIPRPVYKRDKLTWVMLHREKRVYRHDS